MVATPRRRFPCTFDPSFGFFNLQRELQQPTPLAPGDLISDQAHCRNRMNRHTSCTSYCLRRDPHGRLFCRFKFPIEPREPSTLHIYAEVVKGGVRWRLHLPTNDPLMNMVINNFTEGQPLSVCGRGTRQ